MAFNVKAAVAAAKTKGPDMTQTSAGGGYEIPAVGFTRLRFVGYIELGKKEYSWQGTKKINDSCELIFELSGPKHPPRVGENGTKYPIRITDNQKISLNEKANFIKLFNAMNWEGKATHIAELLGNDFIAEVSHNKKTIEGKEMTFANLDNIRKPFGVNPETGDEYRIVVDQPITELKLFLWDFATPEMWDALYIEGEYEARKDDKGNVTSPARSKNVMQEKIKKALNWKGSPVYAYATKGQTPTEAAALDEALGGESEDAPRTEVTPDADDPMGGAA